MTTEVSLSIDNIRHGWADANLIVGDQTLVMDGISYVSAAFDDLARFATRMALDDYEASIYFENEPGGWRWCFRREWSTSEARPRVQFWVELVPDEASTGKRLISVEVNPDALATSILRMLQNIEKTIGVELFESAWMQPFPIRGLRALESALAVDRRPPMVFGEPISSTEIVGSEN